MGLGSVSEVGLGLRLEALVDAGVVGAKALVQRVYSLGPDTDALAVAVQDHEGAR